MKEAGHTRQERKFIATMRVFAVLFFGTSILVVTIPELLVSYVTRIGLVLFSWKTGIPPSGEASLWTIPAASLLFVSGYISHLVSTKPLEYILFTRIIILSKLFTIIGFIVLFIRTSSFISLTASVIDALLLLIIWSSYRGATESRYR